MLQQTESTSSDGSRTEFDRGSFMERLGADMEEWLEKAFTSWGTC